MFYEAPDVIITIGGAALESAKPALNGIGGIGNVIADQIGRASCRERV